MYLNVGIIHNIMKILLILNFHP
uniref:Uncharacterized protein n=1 Tax=Arundo donax TaxID=35708 RepID=A0A0A9ARH3_ARUDO